MAKPGGDIGGHRQPASNPAPAHSARYRLLIQVISNYIASWNEDSAPFEWTATAADIIEKVALLDRDFRKLSCNLS